MRLGPRLCTLLAAGLTLGSLFGTGVAPARAVTPGFFGATSTFQPDSADLSQMGQARLGNLRLPFGWEELEPSPGTYNFSNFDRVMAGAAAQGIPVRPFFFGTPPWARDCTGIPAFYCDRVTPMRTALGSQRWPILLQTLVGRYGPHGSFWTDPSDAYSPPYDPITEWQLWNEPNSATYMRPSPTPEATCGCSAAVRGRFVRPTRARRSFSPACTALLRTA